MFKVLLMLIAGIFLSIDAFAQQITVKGIVKDTTGEPVIGANVVVKGTTTGTITDFDGNFQLSAKQGDIIVVSFIGYQPQELPVAAQMNVILKDDTEILDEVVVIGYGQVKKNDMTGSVMAIKPDELSKGITTNAQDMLSGKIAGVSVISNDGTPGGGAQIRIRGGSSLTAENDPLIVIDGLAMDNKGVKGLANPLSMVNPNDIESFTVLKDASATAIYGSKGANGVVLITTKRGKAGKIKIDAKVETTYNTRTVTPKFEDGFTYASLMNESRITRNNEAVYKPEELDILRLGLDTDLYPNVDWMDMLLKDGAWSNRINLNMSGGGTTARYFVSASYVKEDGMYNTDESLKDDYNTNAAYHRWNYRLNTDIDITKTTLLKVGVAGFLSKRNSPGLGDGDVWGELFGYNPIKTPVMYSNGYIPAIGSGNKTNPWVAATQTGFNENWTNNIETNISLEQNFDFITKGLKFVGRFGYDSNN